MNEMKTNQPRTLLPNPLHATLPVSGIVHCSFSGRRIKVSRSDRHGQVWELVESGHPACGVVKERFIGFGYAEFEPMFR